MADGAICCPGRVEIQKSGYRLQVLPGNDTEIDAAAKGAPEFPGKVHPVVVPTYIAGSVKADFL